MWFNKAPNDPRRAVGVAPAVQGHGRMNDVLGGLQDHRPGFAFDVDDALHPQQVRAAQRGERLQRRVQAVPGEGLIESQAEGTDRSVVIARELLSEIRVSIAEPTIEFRG